jgi:hypothetical protein
MLSVNIKIKELVVKESCKFIERAKENLLNIKMNSQNN